MRRKILKRILLSFIVSFVVSGWLFLACHYEAGVQPVQGQTGLIRFHVLANSDSVEDQNVKLKVRDAVVSYLTPYLKDVSDMSVARQIILEHHDDLIGVAQRVLINNGATYPVRIEHGIFEFPIKSYGSITLPAGKYEAVRILLGKAEGKNWWCILFPPLCFIDVTNAAAIPSVQNNKESDQTGTVEFRWKIGEFIAEAVSK